MPAPTSLTWTAGSSVWDPLTSRIPIRGRLPALGDCSNIITQTTVFTYTGPVHNQIPGQLSETDRSGDTIWTPDFSPTWFDDFLFGNGITFNYTRTDESVVFEDFTGKSVANFYSDLSSGIYNITGDVIGWVSVPHSPMWYAETCARAPGPRDQLDL